MSIRDEPGINTRAALCDAIEEVTLDRHAPEARSESALDAVVREEPLGIEVDGTRLAVVMRTPGHDAELVLGFLVAERVIEGVRDVASLHAASLQLHPDGEDNVIRVLLREGLVIDVERMRRHLYAPSSCGVCGRTTVDGVLATAPPLDDETRFDAPFFAQLPDRLRALQEVFARTGGLHAAAIVTSDGEIAVLREDVGRHNAVDKVIGWAARSGLLPLSGHVLLISGRVSFEIVQKAVSARIPVVAAVSAPSSLAIALATKSRVAIVAFLRGASFNVYGARERVHRGSGTRQADATGGA